MRGFFKKTEQELLIQRRGSRKPLENALLSPAIGERHYQHHGIRRITQSFERDYRRKAPLVMGTGVGTTRAHSSD